MVKLFKGPKLIILVVILIIAAVWAFSQKSGGVSKQSTSSSVSENNSSKIISTKPSPLNEAVILPNQVIEITFNDRLENAPETKIVIDPKIDFKVELSDDHKTAKIIPQVPFSFGQGYTIFIKPETKFEGKKTLGKEEVFRVLTISYKGI